MTAHEKLVKKAETAIDEVFSDTTVGPEQKMDDWADLTDFIDMKMDAIKSDIEAQK